MALARRSPETWHASAVRDDVKVGSCGIWSYWTFSAARYLRSVGEIDIARPPVCMQPSTVRSAARPTTSGCAVLKPQHRGCRGELQFVNLETVSFAFRDAALASSLAAGRNPRQSHLQPSNHGPRATAWCWRR